MKSQSKFSREAEGELRVRMGLGSQGSDRTRRWEEA